MIVRNGEGVKGYVNEERKKECEMRRERKIKQREDEMEKKRVTCGKRRCVLRSKPVSMV